MQLGRRRTLCRSGLRRNGLRQHRSWRAAWHWVLVSIFLRYVGVVQRADLSRMIVTGLNWVGGVHRNKKRRLMSALGHKRTKRHLGAMSALPPKDGVIGLPACR